MTQVAVIGAGPAGLMAAETLAAKGVAVTVFDAMPSAGRKFLMAGRGGLNLTHAEPFETFVTRYGEAAGTLRPHLEAFPPSALIAWANELGAEGFVGTSGRVFPRAMKASPLLRAWLARLNALGVRFELRRRWRGWDDAGALLFTDAQGQSHRLTPDSTILALGGASWAKLGADGAWANALSARGVELAPFQPANCGFAVTWSDVFRLRFQGAPLKGAAFTFDGVTLRGEAVVSSYGLEGGAIYALSRDLRTALAHGGRATLTIDLRPDLSLDAIAAKIQQTRSGETLSNRLRRTLGLSPVAIGLLREAHGVDLPRGDAGLAACLKASPLQLISTAPIDRAISTAGGVAFSALTDALELRALPGVFVAGEMLDWEAPTGGYLLQACFATGVAAANGARATLT